MDQIEEHMSPKCCPQNIYDKVSCFGRIADLMQKMTYGDGNAKELCLYVGTKDGYG